MSNKKEDVTNSLLLAVSCGQLKKVEELVNRHGLSFSPDLRAGYTLLVKATLFGYTRIVKFLLEKGVHTSRCLSTGPLHFAAWFGDAELVELLLNHNAVTEQKNERDERSLHIACQRGHTNIVRLLLNRGAASDPIRGYPAVYRKQFEFVEIDQVAFDSACRGGHKGFEEILDYGAQIIGSERRKPPSSSRDVPSKSVHRKSENEGDVTPLHLAAEMGYLEIVELLLEHHAFVDSRTRSGSTALFLAVANGHKDVAELLLERGAHANTSNADRNPLYFAVQRRWTKMVECLLDRGASFDERTKSVFAKMVKSSLDEGTIIDDTNADFSPLHLAVGCGLKKVVVLFLNAGYAASAVDQLGNALISYSLNSDKEGEHAATIQLLLDHGADLKQAPSLLHKAVSKQNFPACQVLIKNGADVNALGNINVKVSPGGSIPHQVVPIYEVKKAEYLETGESAVLQPDADEELTPLHVACFYGSSKIVELLLNSGANIEARQVKGLTPLHVVAMNGNKDTVEALIKYNADVDALGPCNETALHYGVLGNKSGVVLILLNNGCDLNVESIDGETALKLAVQSPRNKSRYRILINIFKFHLVTREIAGLYVSKNVLQHVDLKSEFDARQQILEREVVQMKGEVLLDKYTLHDVLLKQGYPIHMRNESLVKCLETFDYHKYRLYGKLLESAFRKSKEKIKLIDSAREWLRVIMKISNIQNVETLPIPAWPELEAIVSYLSKGDLLSLIACGENLKRQFCQ